MELPVPFLTSLVWHGSKSTTSNTQSGHSKTKLLRWLKVYDQFNLVDIFAYIQLNIHGQTDIILLQDMLNDGLKITSIKNHSGK